MCASVMVLCALLMTSVAVSGERLRKDICVQQCQSRCHPLAVRLLCCDCSTICRISCSVSVKGSSCRGLCGTQRGRRSPGVREAALIARSVGLDLSLGSSLSHTVRQQPRIQVPPVLRLESLSREGEGTLTARVGWSVSSDTGHWYLVSWRAEGLDLTANLVTNTTTANLTLQPETRYHVQVSSMSSGSTSECLEVDTHLPDSRSADSQLSHTPSPSLSHPHHWLGSAAAVLVFLVVASSYLLITRARRGRKDHRALSDCDHFKVYPPPITLLCTAPAASAATHYVV